MTDKNGNKTTQYGELIKRLHKVEWLPEHDVIMHATAIVEGIYSEREFLEEGKAFYEMTYNPHQDL